MSQVRVPDHVVFRPFGKEMVLLNLRTGQYHGLNQTGGRMLEVLKEVGDTNVAAERISTEFGRPVAEVSRDISELCEALAKRELVEIDGDSGAAADPGAGGQPGA